MIKNNILFHLLNQIIILQKIHEWWNLQLINIIFHSIKIQLGAKKLLQI